MNIQIGNKDLIAVEIKSPHLNIAKSAVGYARLWLGNNFFGTIYDYIYLDGYLLGGLFQVNSVPFLNPAPSFTSCSSAFNYFYKRLLDDNDSDVHKNLVNFETMTDMFTIFAYKSGDSITILWRIRTDDGYNLDRFEDLRNYPKKAFLLYSEI